MAPVTGASVNIIVRSMARQALAELGRVEAQLNKTSAAATASAAAINTLGVAANQAVAIADLAASVELLNNASRGLGKRATAGATGITNLGNASAKASASIAKAAAATTPLAANMAKMSAATALSTTALANFSRQNARASVDIARADSVRLQSAVRAAGVRAKSLQEERIMSSKAATQIATDAQRVAQAEIRTAAVTEQSTHRVAAAKAMASSAHHKLAADAEVAAARIAKAEAAQQMASMRREAGAGMLQMDRFNRTLHETGYTIRKAGSQFQWAGRQIAMNIGMPFAMITGAAAKFYLEQDKLWTSVAKVYGDGSAQAMDSLDAVRETLNKMSVVYGTNREEIYQTAEAYAALGLTGGNLAGAVRNALETSIVGNMDLAKSTEALVAVQNQWQLSVAGTREALMEMNAISNRGPAVLRDLIDAMQRVGSTAKTAGLTVAETAGLISTLTPATGSAATAGNGLRSILSRIAGVTPKASEGLEKLGVSTERWRRESVGMVERLLEVSAAFQRLDETSRIELASDIFTRFQAGRSLQIINTMGEEWGEFQKALRNTGQDIQPIIDRLEELGYVFSHRTREAIDETRSSLEVWNSELELFLHNSEAISMQQQWQRLRGAMADAIKPLIPTLIMFVAMIAKAAEWFANLSPEVRKNILMFGALVAIIGPLLMFFATLFVMLGVGMMAFAKFAAIILLARKSLLDLLAAGGVMKLLFGWLGKDAEEGGKKLNDTAARNTGKFRAVHALGLAAIPGVFGRMFRSVIDIVSLAWVLISTYSTLGMKRLGAAIAVQMAPILKIWRTFWTAMVMTSWVAWGTLKAGVVAMLSGLGNALATAGAFIARIAFTALIKPILVAIGAAVVAIAGFLGIPAWAVVALIAAVSAAIIAVWHFRDEIAQAFVSARNWLARATNGATESVARGFAQMVSSVGKSLSWLPRIVHQIFENIRKNIERHMQAIYNALQYLNPFKRHSPSLVESVDAGMNAVMRKYSLAADVIQANMANATAAVQRFRAESAGVVGRAGDIQYQKTYNEIRAVDPKAANAYAGLSQQSKILQNDLRRVESAIKTQEAVVKRWKVAIQQADRAIEGMNEQLELLRERASAVSKELQHAEKQLQHYSSAPLVGMEAMSDAIFENQMAQKRLRLEIMKLEDIHGPIDATRDKFALLQGEIETLTGQRESLRQAGAGSDILGEYDRMIAEMRKQQDALATTEVSRLQQAQDELDALARRGEMLDLENSLKFDPLTRQIDKAANSMREIPFEQALAGTRFYRAEVDRLTVAQEHANAAVEQQEAVIKQATKARDEMAKQLRDEEEQLQALQEVQREISDTLREVENEMNSVSSAAGVVTKEMEEQARALEEQAKAAEKSAGGVDKLTGSVEDFADAWNEIEPVSKLINDEMLDLEDINKELDEQLKRIMEGFEFSLSDLNPFKGWWDKIKNWFREKMDGVSEWFRELPGKIGSALGNAWTSVTDWFSGLGSAIWEWFTGLWPDHIKPGVEDVPVNLGQWFRELPSRIVSSISYMVGYTSAFFVQEIQRLFRPGIAFGEYFLSGQWLTDIGDIWNNTIKPWWLHNVIIPLGRFVFETIPNAFTAVRDYFLEGGFQRDTHEVRDSIRAWAKDNIRDPLRNFFQEKVPEFFSRIHEYFSSGQFKMDAYMAIIRMTEWGGDLLSSMWEGIKQKMGNAWDWIDRTIFQPFMKAWRDRFEMHSPSEVMARLGWDIIEGLWKGMWEGAKQLPGRIAGLVKDKILTPFRNETDSHSPSRIMMALGHDITEGLAIGIAQNAHTIESTITRLAQTTTGFKPEIKAGIEMDPASFKAWLDYERKQGEGLARLEGEFTSTFGNIRVGVRAQEDGMISGSVRATADWGAVTNTLLKTMHSTAIADTTNWTGATHNLLTQMANNSTTTTKNATDTMTSHFTANRDAMTSLSASTRDNVSTAFTSMSSNLSSIFTNGIRPTFESFSPMLRTTEGWFSDTVNNIGTIWDNMRPKTADPARFVINDVYNAGIREAWNKVNEWLDLPPLDSFVAKFAYGGRVLGAGSATSDSIPALLSNGEHVVTDREVRGAGGHAAIERVRAQWRTGRPAIESSIRDGIMAYAGGGPVTRGHPTGGIPVTPHQQSIWDAVKTAFPGAILTSGKRFADVGAGYDYHMQGMAIDVDGPRFGIANWIADTYMPQTLELILGDGFSRNINNGRPFQYSASTLAQHGGSNAHVHWATAGPVESDGRIVSTALGGAAGRISLVEQVSRAFDETMEPIKAKIGTDLAGVKMIRKAGFEKFHDPVREFLVNKASEMDAMTVGNIAYNASAGVEQWRGTVEDVLRAQGRPLNWTNITLSQIQSESGGDPNAVNRWDSNWHRGTPSVGLLQVIGPTYAGNKDPRFDRGPYVYGTSVDPHANISAAMNYMVRTYGSPFGVWGRGMGYDIGGYLQPGTNMAVNATGSPEPVLTSAQWQLMTSIAHTAAQVANNFGSWVTRTARSIGSILTRIFRNPLPIQPVKPIPVQPPANPPPPPPTPLPEEQIGHIGDLLSVPIAGLEGVFANMPRKIGEHVVPEWPKIVEPVIPPPEPPPLPEINLPPGLVQPPEPPPGGGGPGGGGEPGGGTPGGGTGTPGSGSFPTDLAGQLAEIANRINKGAQEVGATMAPILQQQAKTLTPHIQNAAQNMGSVLQQASGKLFTDPHGAFRMVSDAWNKNTAALAPELHRATQQTFPALQQAVIEADRRHGLTADQQEAVMRNLIAGNVDLKTAIEGQITATREATSLTLTASGSGDTVTIHINGNLEFPNVRSGNDVHTLINNLKALTGR